METVINTAMLILARESRGLSQAQLAEAIGMSATNLSKIERAEIGINDDNLHKIATLTGYPLPFFTQKGQISPEYLSYRKREVVAQKLLNPVNAKANIIRLQVQQLAHLLHKTAPFLPKMPVNEQNSPQNAAKQLRQQWQVGAGAINNLTWLIESHGILIAQFDFNTPRIDSRTMLTDDKQPIIFTNSSLLADRQRFSLAYELGQLVMHSFVPVTIDQDISHEANLFAAELLMPEADIRPDFEQGITIPVLAQLKTKWKVSMISLLYRSDDLGYLTPNQKRYLLQQFNSLNIRRREPMELDIEPEQPMLLRQWANTLQKNLLLNTQQIATLLCLSTEDYLEQYVF